MLPNSVGNQWVYKYNNGISTADQYIYVNIVGTGTLPDGRSATIWTSTTHDPAGSTILIDSSFAVIDNQQAIFYTAPCSSCTPPILEERRFVFPLQVGNVWFTSRPSGDTTKVLSKGTLTVPAGTFENTFQLSKTVGYVTNSFTKDTLWYTPGIGITKYNRYIYNVGPPTVGNGIWELSSYTLK